MSKEQCVTYLTTRHYGKHEPERIKEGDLEMEMPYTFMARLTGGEHEALQTSIKIVGRQVVDKTVVVNFVYLNEDLEDMTRATGAFWNGYIIPRGNHVFRSDARNSSDTLEVGYLRDYFDVQFGDMLRYHAEEA